MGISKHQQLWNQEGGRRPSEQSLPGGTRKWRLGKVEAGKGVNSYIFASTLIIKHPQTGPS